MSGNSWANMGQECIKCHINVYPHKQVSRVGWDLLGKTTREGGFSLTGPQFTPSYEGCLSKLTLSFLVSSEMGGKGREGEWWGNCTKILRPGNPGEL